MAAFVLARNSPLLPPLLRRPLEFADATVMDMTKLRATLAIGCSCCGAMLVVKAAMAQMPLPEAKPPDAPTLSKQQCAICHTSNLTDPVRQGPSLFGVVGRRAGSADGLPYSPAF